MCMYIILLLLSVAGVLGQQNVSVVRMQLSLEETYTIKVDVTTEYILDFVPTAEQSEWPARVWLSADGGDTSRPLLITYRQRAGAGTWQLPYATDATRGVALADDAPDAAAARLVFQLERTLCPDDSFVDEPSDCVGPNEVSGGWFSLHAVSACARALTVQLRAQPVRDFRLQFEVPLVTTITPEAPRVHYYRFPAEQQHVRLVLESDDDVCATISVQDYTCPIAETLADIESFTIRMTMTRSGAVQLSRRRFPRGFYVVSVVHSSERACVGDEAVHDDWLWAAAVMGDRPREDHAGRTKTITIQTKAALTRAQYAWAALAALGVFVGFYVTCGALLLARRWPAFRRLVAPRAVLAKPSPESGMETETDRIGSSPARRRRLSDATFDSSDNSDSDTSDDGRFPPTTATPTPPTTGTHTNGAPTSPTNGAPTSPTNGAPTTPTGPSPVVTSTPVATEVEGTRDVTDAPINSNGNSVVDGTRQTQVAGNGEAGPFGLPAQLVVSALSRRRARVLRARSDRYLHALYTVAVFYALPVLQFVAAFQIFLNVSGSLDTCYYNFLCAHPLGQLSDFNHVFSNLGYLLLGALLLLQLRRRQRARRRHPRDEEYGIPAHYGLLKSLGAGMMVVALLSASYHVCPNRLNFQFDTAFMYVLAVLAMVKLYQARHPDVNARAHATFAVLAVLMACVVWAVLGGGALFWGVWTVLHVFTFLLLSLRIYYLGQFRLEKASIAVAARELRRGLRPLYTARLVMLLIANLVNWAFALYGLFKQSADFASHLLFVLLCNTLLYMVFYLVMKLLHGERPRWYSWCFTAGAACAWAPALYLFSSGSSSWAAAPAQSRRLNHECRVLRFYDAHDLWHMLSAVALYLSFNALLTWDDGLQAVPRDQIAVF